VSSAAVELLNLPAALTMPAHIGDRLQEKFSFPSQDGTWTSREKGEPYCIADTSENVTCHGDLKIWNGSGYTVGGVSVDLTYGFLNLKLHSLTMTFYSSSHNKIREMLIGKYGKTSYEYAGTIYTAANQYHNTVSHWQFREGFLVLTEVVLLPITGILNFHPFTVMEASPDPEAIQLRMLGKRTF
jgi:hypothetical protein